jgi:hypothetical protein
MQNHVNYTRNEGCYNLLNLKEKSAQYIFKFGKWEDKAKELGIKRSYLLPIEDDPDYSMEYDTPRDVAWSLYDYFRNNYLYSSYTSDLKKLTDFLDEIDLENDVEYAKYMKEKSEADVIKWTEKLVKAEQRYKKYLE